MLVGGTGLYLRAVVDDLNIPARYPEIAAELDADHDTAKLYGRLTGLDPRSAARMEPTNRRRIIRALEVCLGSGQPFSSFGPGLDTYPPTRFDLVGLWLPRTVVADRIAARYHEQLEAGFLDEVRRLAGQPRPLSRTATQALGYRELLGARARRPDPGRGDQRRDRTDPEVRSPPARVVPARPAHHLDRCGGGPLGDRADPRPSRRGAVGLRETRRESQSGAATLAAMAYRLTKHHGLGNDFLVLLGATADLRGVDGDVGAPLV